MALMGLLHLIGCLPLFFMNRKFPLGLFSLDGEANIPTLFSVLLLWLCSLLAGSISYMEKGRNEGVKTIQWFGLAVAFFVMGLDEFIQIHEHFSGLMSSIPKSSGAFHYAWVFPYLIFILVFSGIYLKFFFDLLRETRWLVAGAAILYIGGCVGFEVLAGMWLQAHDKDSIYYLFVMIEELLEMSGCILFIYAFTNHIEKSFPDSQLLITLKKGRSA